MKIGILTYHSVYNFGANLQAFSTIGYLKSRGHEPIVIDYIPEELEKGYNKSMSSVQAAAHKEFIEKNFVCTSKCRDSLDVANAIKEMNLEAVVIGSDAVLQHFTFLARLRFTRKGIKLKPLRPNVIYPNPFWGSFLDELDDRNFPVMVISGSSQNTKYKLIKGKTRRRIGDAVLRFKHVTVRDKWTRDMIKYLSRGKVKPTVTPDPVFAYNQNVDSQLTREEIIDRFSLPENYLLLSFRMRGVIDEEWIKRISNLAAKDGIQVVLMAVPGGIVFDKDIVPVIDIPLKPDEWYALIKYSQGYVGQNMHPVVVAMHNAVPFYSFDSYGILKYRYFVNEHSSKIYDLLDDADFLTHRITTLNRGFIPPEPELVYERVKHFDAGKCAAFRDRQLSRYNAMMEKILEL